MVLNIILTLDIAQESVERPEELDLRRRLKRKIVGLAIVNHARKSQVSRITHLKEGDANTIFFHIYVNFHQRKKNHS
jgi:hypothetical protein